MHGASTAERHAAAEFRAGHVQRVAKHPKQRHVRADFNGLGLAVQSESDGHGNLPPADEYPTTIRAMDENLRKLVPQGFRRPYFEAVSRLNCLRRGRAEAELWAAAGEYPARRHANRRGGR